MDAVATAVNLIRKGLHAAGMRGAEKYPTPPLEKGKFDYVAEAGGEDFVVGFAKETVTPPDINKKTYWVAGYGMYKPASAVLDEIMAHAVWIDDRSGHGGIALVSVDAIGIMKADVDRIRASMKGFCEQTGCRAIHIFATHDHASLDTMGIWGMVPLTGRRTAHLNLLLKNVQKAVYGAYNNRKPGALYHGTVKVPDMQEDIRLPVVYSDVLTRLRFVPNDGSAETYIINFASHSESLSSSNSMVSADFPGYFRREILKRTGAECCYCLGAIGGMISMKTSGRTLPEKIQQTMDLGVKLAGYCLSINNERRLKPKISIITQEFYFSAENSTLMLMGLFNVLPTKREYSKDAPLGYIIKSELTYMELDDIKMAFIPGELFPELAYGGYLDAEHSATRKGAEANPLPLCEMAGDPDMLIFGLANDEVGYIVPPNDFILSETQPYLDRAKDHMGRNHYEETNSLGPNTAPKIAEVFAGVLETVKQAKRGH
ncbi:MAG: hypothetical protein FWF08_03740 [Oscillospiraceae bacterium]|nr:hypothetical protein [Oscillospiraceae bacterium]